MTRIFIGMVVIAVIAASIGGVLKWSEQRGVEAQVARDIAAANQNIAERRKTDAKFNSKDARALCDSFGLVWVQRDSKSFCE